MEIMKRLVREEEGQGMVEYALIIAVISIALVVAGDDVPTLSKVYLQKLLDLCSPE